MQGYLIFNLAFLLIKAAAQSPTPTNSQLLPIGISTEIQNVNIPPCILQCLTEAARVVGCGTMDKTCACNSIWFQQTSRTCLQSKCSPLDQAAATLLQENQCTNATTSSTMSLTTQTEPVSTTSPNDALTFGYGVGNLGWVVVAGALGIIVAF